MYSIDHLHKLILVNQDVDLINSFYPDTKSDIALDVNYSFDLPVEVIQTGILYSVKNSSNVLYRLFFTQLPVINIYSGAIVDEPKVLASFKLVESNGNIITSDIGIEYRGAWAQTQPKKPYRIEFWTDKTGKSTHDVSLLGMRSDDDWNLQAMYNEPMRIRSKTNNDLWKKIHTVYYQRSEPDAVNGITMKYAELFLNDEYKGVFCVGEPMDRKQLKLKKHNGSIRGEMYKGIHWGDNAKLNGVEPFDNNSLIWGSFEYEHPEEEIDWQNLYDFVYFAAYSSTDVFNEEYKARFDVDNAVDYFLFLNLLRATDNQSKNIFIAKYNEGEPYFYAPWDLDGTYGVIWDGSKEDETNDILTNNFYTRMRQDYSEDGFVQKLERRWSALRSTIITKPAILKMFEESYDYLYFNGVYEREHLVWPSFSPAVETEFTYMSNWLERRLKYLDEVFNYNPSNLIGSPLANHIKLYPNPTQHGFFVRGIEASTSLIITDLGGRIVFSQTVSNDEYVSVNLLPEGVYVVNIQSSNGCVKKKIIKHGRGE